MWKYTEHRCTVLPMWKIYSLCISIREAQLSQKDRAMPLNISLSYARSFEMIHVSRA